MLLSLYCLQDNSSLGIISKIESLIAQNQHIKLNIINDIDQILSSDINSIPSLKVNDKLYKLLDSEWLHDGSNKIHIEELLTQFQKH